MDIFAFHSISSDADYKPPNLVLWFFIIFKLCVKLVSVGGLWHLYKYIPWNIQTNWQYFNVL